MPDVVPFENAVDLLDADHKAVKKHVHRIQTRSARTAPPRPNAVRSRRAICQALTVHAQIEEEIFYPAVREALDDAALIDEALEEHAEAKALIAEIQGMKASSDNLRRRR